MREGASDESGVVRVGHLLWKRMIWRHWRREPMLTLLLIGVLAMGVAVFLAVRLANKAAVSGFGLFTESIVGESDFILRPASGNLSDSMLGEVRSELGTIPVSIFPVLEVSAELEGRPEKERLKVIGADVVALQNFAQAVDRTEGEQGTNQTVRELGRADRCWVGAGFLKTARAEVGDALTLMLNDRIAECEIAGVIHEGRGRPSVPDLLLLLDLPGAQEMAGMPGALTRAELRIPPGTDADENRRQVGVKLWELARNRGWVLETPEDRKSSVTQMSAAFRMNLTILSGLALLVGMYLIMQAMEAAVVKRRREIAVLRSLGVTPAQVRSAWVWEGVVLGAVGTLVGIVIGRFLALGMVAAISRTVNTLYYETTTASIRLEWPEVAFALGFGVVVSLFAVSIPAREAAMTPPAQTMRQGMQGGGLSLLRHWPLGLVLLVVGVFVTRYGPVALASGTAVPLGGYAASALFVVGMTLLVGLVFRPVRTLLEWGKSGAMRRYAASQIRRPVGRHRLTAAGLAVAIGMSAAMAILVASFESTFTGWIHQLLKADIYVAPAGAHSMTSDNTLSVETKERVMRVDGVDGVDTIRRYRVTVSGHEFIASGVDYQQDPERFLGLMWLSAPKVEGPSALDQQMDDGYPGWVSEALARRFSLGVGSEIPLPTPEGEKRVEVAGIFADYGNEAGTLLLGRKWTRAWFDDERLSNVAVYVNDEAEVETVMAAIREAAPGLVVRSNHSLKEESIRVFHQTFTVTYALEVVAVVIAVAGLAMALAGLLLERRDELSTLKSVGVARKSIGVAAMWESLAIAMAGLVAGGVLSLMLAWVLIYVINPQCFGWTLAVRIPWGSMVGLAVVTLATAGWVGWFVGSRNLVGRSKREG